MILSNKIWRSHSIPANLFVRLYSFKDLLGNMVVDKVEDKCLMDVLGIKKKILVNLTYLKEFCHENFFSRNDWPYFVCHIF